MRVRRIVDFIVFQGAWFAAVLGAAHGRADLGLAAIIGAIALHFTLVEERRRESVFLVFALLFGAAVESAVLIAGLILPRVPTHGYALVPEPWLILLWAVFAATFSLSLSWLRERYCFGAVLGFAAGPMSYAAGVRLGAVKWGEASSGSSQPWPSFLGLGLIWAIAMVVLLRAHARIVGPLSGGLRG